MESETCPFGKPASVFSLGREVTSPFSRLYGVKAQPSRSSRTDPAALKGTGGADNEVRWTGARERPASNHARTP